MPSAEVQTYLKTRTMTPLQEVMNAFSMLVPVAWVLMSRRLGGYGFTKCSWLIVDASLLHAPFSFYYHLRVAVSNAGYCTLPCPIDNTPRRLDQTFIHLSNTIVAFALTGGCAAYAVALAVFNAFAIRLQWQRTVVPPRNQKNLLISGLLGLYLPLFWRRDWANVLRVLTWGVPSVWCFTYYPLGGYSHAIFHVLAGGVLQALVTSTQSFVDPPLGSVANVTTGYWWVAQTDRRIFVA